MNENIERLNPACVVSFLLRGFRIADQGLRISDKRLGLTVRKVNTEPVSEDEAGYPVASFSVLA